MQFRSKRKCDPKKIPKGIHTVTSNHDKLFFQ